MNPEHDQGIQEVLFRRDNEDWYRQYYRVAANNAIRMVSEALPSHMHHRREEIMAKLQAFLNEDVFFRTMSELVSTQGPLSVVCHGDCWTNNILFQSESCTDTEVNLAKFCRRNGIDDASFACPTRIHLSFRVTTTTTRRLKRQNDHSFLHTILLYKFIRFLYYDSDVFFSHPQSYQKVLVRRRCTPEPRIARYEETISVIVCTQLR